MFNLIIAIISIALIVALIAATMYHGGDTLTQGRDRATASAVVAGAQQVSGAAVMHLSLESGPAADVAALISTGYLASAPTEGGLSLATAAKVTELNTALVVGKRFVVGSGLTAGVCEQVNKAAGANDPKAVALADIDDLPYGCVYTGTADAFTGGEFVFKY